MEPFNLIIYNVKKWPKILEKACGDRKIFEVCFVIFQHYEWKCWWLSLKAIHFSSCRITLWSNISKTCRSTRTKVVWILSIFLETKLVSCTAHENLTDTCEKIFFIQVLFGLCIVFCLIVNSTDNTKMCL